MQADHERLEIIVTSEQLMLFERAAEQIGCSLSEFIVTSTETAAEETLRHQVIKLSPEDSIAFVESLLDPQEPNENLRAAARRYRQFFGESPSS